MNTKYFILILLVSVSCMSGCNNPSSNRSRPAAAADSTKKKSPGKIEFTEEMHNFGALKEGETVVYSFRFKNSGDTPFRLTSVEPTCGCLTVQYDKNEIVSQSVSVIDVIFHTDGEWGNQIKTVNIETSNRETKTLTIGAYVENKDFNIDLNNLK